MPWFINYLNMKKNKVSVQSQSLKKTQYESTKIVKLEKVT